MANDTSYFVAASGVVTPTLNPPPVSIQDSTGAAFTTLNPLPVAIVSGGGGGGVSSSVSVTNFPATQAVTGTFWQATQPISATALPLPTGASTETTLSALNTKIPSNLTVTSTRLLVDGSGVTQPVSGTITANIGTSGSLALDATLTGGTQRSKITDGTNNAAVKAASTAAAFTDAALTVDARPGGALVTASAALADALANPTLGQQAVLPSVFNGSTWDRVRGMGVATTTGDTGAKTATGNGATQTNVGNKGIQLVINMGAVTGTTPTCVIKMQGSVDGGTNWYDIPGATTASLTATGIYGISIYPGQAVTAGTTTTGTTATASGILPRTWRVVWTIGGTTPSFTITSITYNYIPN